MRFGRYHKEKIRGIPEVFQHCMKCKNAIPKFVRREEYENSPLQNCNSREWRNKQTKIEQKYDKLVLFSNATKKFQEKKKVNFMIEEAAFNISLLHADFDAANFVATEFFCGCFVVVQ